MLLGTDDEQGIGLGCALSLHCARETKQCFNNNLRLCAKLSWSLINVQECMFFDTNATGTHQRHARVKTFLIDYSEHLIIAVVIDVVFSGCPAIRPSGVSSMLVNTIS